MAQQLWRKVCIYISLASPKIALITFSDGKLRGLELQDQYSTGFPAEIYKKARKKFLSDYGKQAKCSTQRKGETCEVMGHGYRIMLRSETDNDDGKATITRSITNL